MPAATSRAEYWHGLPFGATSEDWRAMVARFVDATGRPGPGELGGWHATRKARSITRLPG